MSFAPNNTLQADPYIYLRSQQHAARLFIDDQFRLLPKQKFLFHVSFSINPNACKDSTLINRHKNEINMLVKSVSLPSFTITNETVNQYNRKRNVQTTHTFGEIDLTFHDDSMSLINQLWQNYYSYYYADSLAAKKSGAYSKNATKNLNYIVSPYGLDNGSNQPFFNQITIYQLSRHEYTSYRLVNPIISSWNHNKLAYSETSPHDFSMKLKYESVEYGAGTVESGNVEGFAIEHYDLTPSPIKGSMDVSSASPSFIEENPVIKKSKLNTIIQQINTYENTKQLNPITSTLTNTKSSSISGIAGVNFPVSKTKTKSTVASSINIGK